MSSLIAVTIGDINGIGIDIYLKLLKENKIQNTILFTNINLIQKYIKKNKYKIKINVVNKDKNILLTKRECLNIYNYNCSTDIYNTIKSIDLSYKECLKKRFKGMVTLPIRKDLINKIYPNFIGHTEHLQKFENIKYSNMIFYHKKIIISPITTHIKLNAVSKFIQKKNFLLNQIRNLNSSLVKDFNIKSPKIIISGINPHAGENGNIGNEEINIIKPIINKLIKLDINIKGPFSADTMLIDKNLNMFDCFIFIYHDQALIPFKYISKFQGVNFTGNLSVIRTSPDHGTAYDLKGKNNISSESLLNSFKLINKIYKNRNRNDKSKKIIKSKFFDR